MPLLNDGMATLAAVKKQHCVGLSQALQAFAAAASAPATSELESGAAPGHLIVELGCDCGRGITLYICRVWVGSEGNGEELAAGKEGPFCVSADAIELAGAANTLDGIKKQYTRLHMEAHTPGNNVMHPMPIHGQAAAISGKIACRQW